MRTYTAGIRYIACTNQTYEVRSTAGNKIEKITEGRPVNIYQERVPGTRFSGLETITNIHRVLSRTVPRIISYLQRSPFFVRAPEGYSSNRRVCPSPPLQGRVKHFQKRSEAAAPESNQSAVMTSEPSDALKRRGTAKTKADRQTGRLAGKHGGRQAT